MTGELLPLFPLRAVLFPGSALPLHIFEERYRVLVAESIREEREFGVILADGDALRPVGCTGLITAVTRRYEDGRLDVEHVERVIPLLDRLESLDRIVRNDGYL